MNGCQEECVWDFDDKTRRKRPVGMPRCRWANNIGIMLDRMGGMDWIDVAQGRGQ
jgi:hypothetical protein